MVQQEQAKQPDQKHPKLKAQESKPTIGNDQTARLMRTDHQESKSTAQPVQDKLLLSQPAINHSLDIGCFPKSIEVYKDGTICVCDGFKLKLFIKWQTQTT